MTPSACEETAVKTRHESALPIGETSALGIRGDDCGAIGLVALDGEDFDRHDSDALSSTRRYDGALLIAGPPSTAEPTRIQGRCRRRPASYST